MQKIEEITRNYLSEKTNYAIQLVGDWGTGKTHFYNKKISPLIKSIETLQDSRKQYKPVYISLFGLKSIDEIALKITLEFYESKIFKDYFKRNVLRRKILKITNGVFKIGLRGFLSFKRLGNLDNYLTDIKEVGIDTLSEQELVICFDDLERIDSNLSLTDFAGYINTLVDNEIKVLIISNEDVLKKLYEDTYSNLKEKVIGITVPFNLNPKFIIDEIINERFESTGNFTYSKFLKDNSNIVYDVSKSCNNNYRHLIFALNQFRHCFSLLKNEVFDSNHEIKDILKENIVDIFKVFIAFSIEYKSSTIEFKDSIKFSEDMLIFLETLNDSSNDVYSIQTSNEQKLESDSMDSEVEVDFKYFSSKYKIERSNYKFFLSMYSYLTNNDFFDVNLFVDEFNTKFNLVGGDVSEEYKLYNELTDWNALAMSEEIYVQKTKELLNYAKKGVYIPSDYLSIYHYCERFGNPCEFDFDKLLEKLKQGLSLSIKRLPLKTHENTRFSMHQGAGLSEGNLKLFDFGLQELREDTKLRTESEIVGSLEFFYTNPNKFINDYYEVPETRERFDRLHIFANLNIDRCIVAITQANFLALDLMKGFFEERYRYSKHIEIESVKLRELNSKLGDCITELAFTGMRLYFIKELRKTDHNQKLGANS